jgi:hypothetical protein
MLDTEQTRAIEELINRYATAVDMRDAALLASCFTSDLKADYGEQLGRFDRRDAFVAHFIGMLTALGPTLHYMTNMVAQPSAGGAKVRTYTQAVVTLPGDAGVIRTAGLYDDVLVETPEGWKIKERVYTTVQ